MMLWSMLVAGTLLGAGDAPLPSLGTRLTASGRPAASSAASPATSQATTNRPASSTPDPPPGGATAKVEEPATGTNRPIPVSPRSAPGRFVSRSQPSSSEEEDAEPASSRRLTWWLSTALGLILVLGVIYAGGHALRRIVPGIAPGDLVGPIQILYRHHLTPKQSLCLVRCGDRLLLIGVSGDQMHTLARFEDPGEIDVLKGQCLQVRPRSATHAFRDLFRGKEGAIGPAGDDEAAEAPLPTASRDEGTRGRGADESPPLAENADAARAILAWRLKDGS